MAFPDAELVLAQSKVDLDSLGFGTPDLLQPLVDAAMGLLGRFTGQSWNPSGIYSNADPAIGTEGLAVRALITLTEMFAYKAQEDVAETLGDFELISSFSAGSYSETRRGGKDAQDATVAIWRGIFWPLMTWDAMDNWQQLVNGINAPAFGVTEVDWSRQGPSADYFFGGTPNDGFAPFTTD